MKNTFTKILAGGIAATLSVSGIDAVAFSVQPLPDKEDIISAEQVLTKQIGNVVEIKLPWKGQPGLTVKYDLGEPTLQERMSDKRIGNLVTEKTSFNGSDGFKADIVLTSKPKTNTFCYQILGWENYDWIKQVELTPQEKARGDLQAPEIPGSYAIYHKTLKNGQYGTGKFGHIPFPYVWEINKESQKIRAQDFTFNNGNLCIIVPQSFLDNADYTNGVRIDPTFGYTTGGTNAVYIYAGYARAYKTTAPADCTVDSIFAYTRVASGSNNFKPVVWKVSDKTVVTNGIGNVYSVSNTSVQWNEATYTTKPSVTNGTGYYVGLVNQSDALYLYHDGTSGTQDAFDDNSNSYASPATLGTNAYGYYKWSIYASCTAGASSSTPVSTQSHLWE